MIRLYGPRDAPFTEKVMRGLALKQLRFELHEPRTPEDYKRWNPETGLLPLIEIDGERVHDSTAILLRVDALHPEPPLLSPDPRTRAAQLNLEHWVDESFFWYWLRWQRLQHGAPQTPVATTDAEAPERPPAPAAQAAARGWRRWLRRRRPEPPPDARDEAGRLRLELAGRLSDVARLLAERPFFYAERVSMADLAVYAMLRSLSADSIPGGAALLHRQPKLLAFMKRVEQATGG